MTQNIATRQAFGEALEEIMAANEQVVALTADLGESLRMLEIKRRFTERFIDVGVAEANMAGIAAGLSLAGYIPVAGTFAVFLTRAFDHIRVQICQNNLHTIMVGSHGGLSNGADGASAQALEDIAYMRTLPNMKIIFPADYNETKNALVKAVDAQGPVYFRLYREPTPVITKKNDSFEIGKGRIFREGKDVTIISSGPILVESLKAADILAENGIFAEVISLATIAPLDTQIILESAAKTRAVVTVEDHSINGGLGSAVAEVLGEFRPTLLHRLGVKKFGESGDYAELIKKMGIGADAIVEAARNIFKK